MTTTLKQTRQPSAVRRALKAIRAGDLGFHDEGSGYASHSLHAFAAKFPPQLPRTFIESLTQRGDTVLDPMMGSGTTIVEAALLGRRAIGVDIDPLAVRLCRAKTMGMSAEAVMQAVRSVVAHAAVLLMDGAALRAELERRYDEATQKFIGYWFLPRTQQQLMALLMAIEEEDDQCRQELLRVVFSSIIVTKSGGVSLARDLAHSRPHRVTDKIPRDAIEQFEARGRKAAAAVGALPPLPALVEIHHGDARALPLADESADLVVTSPPYANAIDYMRAHKFSLVWLGEPVQALSQVRSTYIGSENCRSVPGGKLPKMVSECIRAVARRDARKARVLEKYFGDMAVALAEMRRVLRRGRAAAVVVGPSTMRGVKVETHEHLAEIAAGIGFEVVGIAERQLDRDRRMMPARNDGRGMNGIERRMGEESVIGLVKQEAWL